MPAQTIQVLFGTAVALAYAAIVVTIGSLVLSVSLGPRRELVGARIGLVGLLWLGFVLGQGILGVIWLGLSLAGIFDPLLIWVVCISGILVTCVTLLAHN